MPNEPQGRRFANYEDIRGTLKTGDIVLFSGKGRISDWIKLFTRGTWSHVGMVLTMDLASITNVLLLESTTLNDLPDFETGRARKGVQLVPLSERARRYVGGIAIRALSRPLTDDMLRDLMTWRREASRLGYEESVSELVRSAWEGPLGRNKEDLSSVFCSELVAESYQRMGLLEEPPHGLPSNEYTPKDFSSEARAPIEFGDGYALGAETWIKDE